MKGNETGRKPLPLPSEEELLSDYLKSRFPDGPMLLRMYPAVFQRMLNDGLSNAKIARFVWTRFELRLSGQRIGQLIRSSGLDDPRKKRKGFSAPVNTKAQSKSILPADEHGIPAGGTASREKQEKLHLGNHFEGRANTRDARRQKFASFGDEQKESSSPSTEQPPSGRFSKKGQN